MVGAMIDQIQHLKVLETENNAQWFHTQLPFLNEHRGLRPGKMHVLLSGSGAGKSTLVRTMMIDFLKNNEGNILIWLSEETEDDFMTNLAYAVRAFGPYIERIKLFSEISDTTKKLLDGKKGKRHELLLQIFSKIKERNYSLVIFDNITTSGLYTQDINIQPDMIRSMKEVVKTLSCPFIVVAHTAKNEHLKKIIFDNDSIKGSNVPTQIAEYTYMINTFSTKTKRETFLAIDKSRTHNIENRFFHLNYNKEIKIYDKITSVDKDMYYEVVKASK